MEKKDIDRRGFIKKSGALAGMAFTLPLITGFLSSCESNENPIVPEGTVNLDLDDYPALMDIGGSVKTNVEGLAAALIIIRIGESDFLIANSTCTHLGCSVNAPANDTGNINCPCHGAVYSRTDASVINYPTGANPIPLTTYNYTFNAGSGTLSIDLQSEKLIS